MHGEVFVVLNDCSSVIRMDMGALRVGQSLMLE